MSKGKPCQTCGNECSTLYIIQLATKNRFKANCFKAKVRHCDRCMLGWIKHIEAIMEQLPAGTWKKY